MKRYGRYNDAKKRTEFPAEKKEAESDGSAGRGFLDRRGDSCLCGGLYGGLVLRLHLKQCGRVHEPTLKSGDRVLINRLVYEIKSPSYGDLIVFKPNGNQNAHYHIKRVVGKPGDTITIKSGRVFVNGELLNETVQTASMQDAGLAEDGVKLGADEYFVLGDNRNNSEDSRSANIGNVKKEDILGQAWFVVTPGERFGRLK